MTTLSRLLVCLILVTVFNLILCRKEYIFKRYTYRKKRDDKKYKSVRQHCETNADCHGLWGVKHTACIRKCMSPFCYKELYGEDDLEEGEIDVRLNSFKGCLNQASNMDL